MANTERLLSLDVYRGLIMVILVGGAFGLGKTSDVYRDQSILKPDTHQWLKDVHYHTHHPEWESYAWGEGTKFYQPRTMFSWWDMIQPAFMFMAGVSIPFALRSRSRRGHTNGRILGHAAWRSFVLIAMGVFLYSIGDSRTHFDFMNVLAQIGLGYLFVYAIAMIPGKKYLWISLASVLILGCYSLIMHTYPVAAEGGGAVENSEVEETPSPYLRDQNAGTRFDRWFLNLFPRPEEIGRYERNGGGYQTLNFIPSMATMLFGVFCGLILVDDVSKKRMVSGIALFGVLLLVLSYPVAVYDGPMIKKIWTSSWALFSGGVVVLILGGLVFLFDCLPLQKLGRPIAIVGMNSLAIYVMNQLFGGWLRTQVATHLGWIGSAIGLGQGDLIYYQYIAQYCIALGILWAICYYMDRKEIYLRP